MVAGESEAYQEVRSYPLMLRTADFTVWRSIGGAALFAFGMIIFAPFVLLPVLAIGVALDHEGSFAAAFRHAADLKPVTWQGLLYLNLTLASLVPITWAIVRWVHLLRPRVLASVLPGFRWRFFRACLGLSLVAIAAQLAIAGFLPGDPSGLNGSFNDVTGRLIGLAVVVALTTPLQAIGEEYGFRGYLLQAFGSFWSWLVEVLGLPARRARQIGVVAAIVSSALLFALAHGAQNWPLFFDRFTFGLMAGYVVLRTGGLEAGIAMHIWNNIAAFGFALAIGNIDDTLKVSEISWWNIPLTITQNGVYLLLVLWMARRMGLRSTTAPVSELPPPAWGSTPVLPPPTTPV